MSGGLTPHGLGHLQVKHEEAVPGALNPTEDIKVARDDPREPRRMTHAGYDPRQLVAHELQ